MLIVHFMWENAKWLFSHLLLKNDSFFVINGCSIRYQRMIIKEVREDENKVEGVFQSVGWQRIFIAIKGRLFNILGYSPLFLYFSIKNTSHSS